MDGWKISSSTISTNYVAKTVRRKWYSKNIEKPSSSFPLSFLFYLGIFPDTFTIHRTLREERGSFNSTLLLPPVLWTLRLWPGNYCREFTPAHEVGVFPDSLKFSNITPAHKKDKATDKENYRPVNVQFLFLEIFMIMYDQLSQCQEKYLNSLLCSFRKAHSWLHALLKLLRAWQEELDKSGFAGTILMDLSNSMTLYLMIFFLQIWRLW